MSILQTDGIQFSNGTQLNSFYGIIVQSTNMLFYQSAAPTGWTKNTTATVNNKALRVVSGNGGGSGGSSSFTGLLTGTGAPYTASGTNTGSVGNHTLTIQQIPGHTHGVGSIFSPFTSSGGTSPFRTARQQPRSYSTQVPRRYTFQQPFPFRTFQPRRAAQPRNYQQPRRQRQPRRFRQPRNRQYSFRAQFFQPRRYQRPLRQPISRQRPYRQPRRLQWNPWRYVSSSGRQPGRRPVFRPPTSTRYAVPTQQPRVRNYQRPVFRRSASWRRPVRGRRTYRALSSFQRPRIAPGGPIRYPTQTPTSTRAVFRRPQTVPINQPRNYRAAFRQPRNNQVPVRQPRRNPRAYRRRYPFRARISFRRPISRQARVPQQVAIFAQQPRNAQNPRTYPQPTSRRSPQRNLSPGGTIRGSNTNAPATSSTGGSLAHNHPFTPSPVSITGNFGPLRVQYIDIIICDLD